MTTPPSLSVFKNVKGLQATSPRAGTQSYLVVNQSSRPALYGLVTLSASDWKRLGSQFNIYMATRAFLAQQNFTQADQQSSLASPPSGLYSYLLMPTFPNTSDWQQQTTLVNDDGTVASAGAVAIASVWPSTAFDTDAVVGMQQLADVSLVWSLDSTSTMQPQLYYPSSQAATLPKPSDATVLYTGSVTTPSQWTQTLNNEVVAFVDNAGRQANLLKASKGKYATSAAAFILANKAAGSFGLGPVFDMPIGQQLSLGGVAAPLVAYSSSSPAISGGSSLLITDCGVPGAVACSSSKPTVAPSNSGGGSGSQGQDVIPITLTNSTKLPLYVYVDTVSLGGYRAGQPANIIGKTVSGGNCQPLGSPQANVSYTQGYSYPGQIQSATPLITDYVTGSTSAAPWTGLPQISANGTRSFDLNVKPLKLNPGQTLPMPVTVNAFWYLSNVPSMATVSFMTLQNQVSQDSGNTFDYAKEQSSDCTSSNVTVCAQADDLSFDYSILMTFGPSSKFPTNINVSGGPSSEPPGLYSYCDPANMNSDCPYKPNTVCYGLDQPFGGPTSAEFPQGNVKGWCGPVQVYEDVASTFQVTNNTPYDLTVAAEMPDSRGGADLTPQMDYSWVGQAKDMAFAAVYTGGTVVAANTTSKPLVWLGGTPLGPQPKNTFSSGGNYGSGIMAFYVNQEQPAKGIAWLPDAVVTFTAHSLSTSRGAGNRKVQTTIDGRQAFLPTATAVLTPGTAQGGGVDGIVTVTVGGQKCKNCGDCSAGNDAVLCPAGTTYCCGASGYCECSATTVANTCPGEVGGDPLANTTTCLSNSKACSDQSKACVAAGGKIVYDPVSKLCVCQQYPASALGYDATLGHWDADGVKALPTTAVTAQSLPPGKWFFVWAPTGKPAPSQGPGVMGIESEVPFNGITFSKPDFMGLPIDLYAYSLDLYPPQGGGPLIDDAQKNGDGGAFLVAQNVVLSGNKTVLFSGAASGAAATTTAKRQRRNALIAAIVLGSLAVAVTLGSLLAWWLWRRRRSGIVGEA